MDEEKIDSSPSSPFQYSSNSPGSQQRKTTVDFLFQLHDNHPSPDNPPQDLDKSSHLSDSTSTTNSLNESSTLSTQDDHLLQVDSTSLSSQDISSVEIGFVLESEEQLDNDNISQTDNFLTMNCSY